MVLQFSREYDIEVCRILVRIVEPCMHAHRNTSVFVSFTSHIIHNCLLTSITGLDVAERVTNTVKLESQLKLKAKGKYSDVQMARIGVLLAPKQQLPPQMARTGVLQ